LKETKHIAYLGLSLGMLFYAVPKLDMENGWTVPTIFGLLWVAFALLVVAAHLHEILGVEEEAKRQVAMVRRMKKWQFEQLLQGKRKLLQFKK
jgi:hypothetical protein